MKDRNLEGQYAGFLTRAVGFVLDYIFVTAIILGIGLTVTLILRALGVDVVTSCQAGGSSSSDVSRIICAGGQYILLGMAALTPPLYYVLLWTLVGQTLGQRIMGVQVVRLDGRSIGVTRSLVRWLGYLFCALTLGIGFLWVLVDDRRMGWHDKFAGTTVLYSWKAVQYERVVDKAGRQAGGKRTQADAGGAAEPGALSE
jgi:uncharacterized RDD family membrane protein YckC